MRVKPPGPSVGYLVYLCALSLWFLAILAAPILASSETLGPVSRVIYGVFSGVCHQNPARSFQIFGQPLAACARCTFIYLGVLLSSAAYPFMRLARPPRLRHLFAAATPLVLDAGTQLIGLRESTNTMRAITGLVFGLAIALYIAPEAEETVSLLAGRVRRLAIPRV